MVRSRRLVLVTAILLALMSMAGHAQRATTPPAAKPAMTNADVIKMTKAGLSDAVLINAIQDAVNRAFDRSPDALIALKQAGVSDGVIQAMFGKVAPVSSMPTKPTAPEPDPNDPLTRHTPGIYFDQSGGTHTHVLVSMQGSSVMQLKTKGGAGSAFSFGIAKTSRVAIVGGAQSHVRFTVDPVFYFYFEANANSFGTSFGPWMAGASSPDQFVLVEMTSNVKADDRELEIGRYGAYSSSTGVQGKDRVDIKSEALAPGIFRVTTGQHLSPGEFCFFYAQGAGTLAGGMGKLFDFGIDPIK